MLMSEQLADLGYAVVGPACNMTVAQQLAGVEHFDAALLDINLNGVFSGPIAELLAQRKIPFLFVTGYDRPPKCTFENVDHLSKPYTHDDLRRAVERLLAQVSADKG